MASRTRTFGIAIKETDRLDDLVASRSQLENSFPMEVRRLRAIAEQTERALQAVVAAAREAGETWEDIAVMTGMTVGGAHKRFRATSPNVDLRVRVGRSGTPPRRGERLPL